MTIVIGLVCSGGVVVASDSQVEFARGAPVKRVNANKVYQLDHLPVAIAGAGTLTFIKKAIREIENRVLEERRKEVVLPLSRVADLAEGVVAAIHKTYNIERLKYLYEREEERLQEVHRFTLLMGGVEEGRGKLFILHQDGIAEEEDKYATIGSGAAYAEYLLSKLYAENISIEKGVRTAVYVIKEVEKIDPNVGGPINVAVVDKSNYRELPRSDIEKIELELADLEEAINQTIRKMLWGELEKNVLKKFLEEQ